jgi:hypothetical protein
MVHCGRVGVLEIGSPLWHDGRIRGVRRARRAKERAFILPLGEEVEVLQREY